MARRLHNMMNKTRKELFETSPRFEIIFTKMVEGMMKVVKEANEEAKRIIDGATPEEFRDEFTRNELLALADMISNNTQQIEHFKILVGDEQEENPTDGKIGFTAKAA
jgi:hypothetical protein